MSKANSHYHKDTEKVMQYYIVLGDVKLNSPQSGLTIREFCIVECRLLQSLKFINITIIIIIKAAIVWPPYRCRFRWQVSKFHCVEQIAFYAKVFVTSSQLFHSALSRLRTLYFSFPCYYPQLNSSPTYAIKTHQKCKWFLWNRHFFQVSRETGKRQKSMDCDGSHILTAFIFEGHE